jgi:hypothetical protein
MPTCTETGASPYGGSNSQIHRLLFHSAIIRNIWREPLYISCANGSRTKGPRPLLRHAVILHWIAIAMWTSGAFEAVRSSRFESRHSGNECLQRIPWKSLNDPTQLHLIQSSRHLLMSSTNIRPRQEKSRKSRRASDSYRLVGQSPPKASLSYTPPSSTLDVMVIAPFCFASITCRLASPGNPCNSGLQNTPLLLVAIPDERPTYLPA